MISKNLLIASAALLIVGIAGLAHGFTQSAIEVVQVSDAISSTILGGQPCPDDWAPKADDWGCGGTVAGKTGNCPILHLYTLFQGNINGTIEMANCLLCGIVCSPGQCELLIPCGG